MRLAAVDGFVLDVPETEANRRRLGGPKDARGQVAGFPQVRVVTLTETGTHAQIDAAAADGEEPPARLRTSDVTPSPVAAEDGSVTVTVSEVRGEEYSRPFR